jgi:crotonobetainyl-CoA:carnitine CoA-transferase CaiB-like acyl-CoA transferase
MLLAELGADVLKIEPPAGDSFRVAGFQYNRGQRSLAMNLRDPAGHAAFLRLVAGSDVVVDNYRPGVLERLKISHDQLAAVRPDVVTVSITGFGDVGPLAGRPGFDPILQAMSGIMAAQGGDSDPVFFTMAVNDVTAACVSVLGVCAALYHRARRGGGQKVTASLCAVSAYMQSGELVEFNGRPPAGEGGRDYPGPSSLSRYYETSDGFVRLHLSSLPQLVDAGILAAVPAAQDAAEAIGASLRTLTSAQVIKAAETAGARAAPARTLADLAREQAILDARYLESLTRADGRVFYVPGRYARFSRTEQTRVLAPPGLGEHSRELLREAGLTADEVDALVAAGSVVQGGPITAFGDVGYR